MALSSESQLSAVVEFGAILAPWLLPAGGSCRPSNPALRTPAEAMSGSLQVMMDIALDDPPGPTNAAQMQTTSLPPPPPPRTAAAVPFDEGKKGAEVHRASELGEQRTSPPTAAHAAPVPPAPPSAEGRRRDSSYLSSSDFRRANPDLASPSVVSRFRLGERATPPFVSWHFGTSLRLTPRALRCLLSDLFGPVSTSPICLTRWGHGG